MGGLGGHTTEGTDGGKTITHTHKISVMGWVPFKKAHSSVISVSLVGF